MTTRYELIAVEQPGTNVKALHMAYQAFVAKLNDLYDRQEKAGESDWWSSFSDPQVHFIDNNIVVFAIMTNVPNDENDEPGVKKLVAMRDEVESLPFDDPPVQEPVVDPPKRKRGRQRKTE